MMLSLIQRCLVLPPVLVAMVLTVYLSGVWYVNTHLLTVRKVHYRKNFVGTQVKTAFDVPPPPPEPPRKKTIKATPIIRYDDNNNNNNNFMIPPLDPEFPLEPHPRPPLSDIVQGWNITGDPSWLLNVAIIGFPKTGTSTLMRYLHKSPQVHIFDEERCELGYNQHVKLMESLYRDIPPGHVLRGIKCPRDLESNLALVNYQAHFPKTDFLVGLRHPIEWFESFYNFRIQNGFPMPPAETLTGRCARRHQGLCTVRGNFHLFLANLGKTNILENVAERALIPQEYHKLIKPIPLQGRIFLWDVSQLKSDEELAMERQMMRKQSTHNITTPHSNLQFRHDLQHFLHLDHPLPDMIKVKPGYSHRHNQTALAHVASKKIDICEPRYKAIRDILRRQGQLAATWIRDYFLQAPGVVVSQPEYFAQVILKQWERDPCEYRRRRNENKQGQL